MTASFDKPLKEQRMFPRIPAQCPVLYRAAESKYWYEGKLVNFSATGVRIECDEMLLPGTPVFIEIRPGDDKVIPAVTGKGTVVRCEANAHLRYEVSCRLTKVKPT